MQDQKKMPLFSRILPFAFLIISSCNEEGSSGSNQTTPQGFRPGASLGSFCQSRTQCEETSAQPITCGCTGEQERPQCTTFGKEGAPCESYSDQLFDLKYPLCGPGLLCKPSPDEVTGVCVKRKAAGEPCNRGDCEEDLWCDQGICTAEKLPLGASCEDGEDQPCAAPNHCEFKLNATCVAPVPIGAECTPRPGINDPCLPEGACPGYVISPASFQCKPRRKDGELCNDAALCFSGVCQQSTCGLKVCVVVELHVNLRPPRGAPRCARRASPSRRRGGPRRPRPSPPRWPSPTPRPAPAGEALPGSWSWCSPGP